MQRPDEDIRLEGAVAELAADVAHRINNPLFAILGTAEFLLEDAPEGSELRNRLLRIQRSGEEIREIVRALVDRARLTGE
jgi:signal transduction histidine kinase